MKTADLLRVVLRDLVPFKPQIRKLKRRLRPYEDDPANSDLCVIQGLQQIAALRQASAPIDGAVVLEFGSGWTPLIPLLFDLAGAGRLVMTDIERLMDAHTIARAKQIIANRMGEIAAHLDAPAEPLQARLAAEFGPDYLVPWQPAASWEPAPPCRI